MIDASPRSRSLLDFRPQPPDRLGILTMLASLYFIQLHSHLLLRLDLDPFSLRNLAAFALLASCVFGVLFARFYPILLVNAGVFFAAYLWRMPVESNNQTLAMFFCFTALAAAACQLIGWRRGQWGLDRDTLFELIAGPGRWLLAIMYFYGIYHKINADFLDPTVSCGTLLYQLLAAKAEGVLHALTGWAPDLVGWPVGQYGAIWGTFIVEGLAMVLLFSIRYKKLGFIIGVPFHILIGWTGYAYYIDFSTIVLVLYVLFLPREATDAAEARLARLFGSATRARATCWAAALVLLVSFAIYAGIFQDWRLARTAQATFVWLFSAYAFAFYAFAVAFVPWSATRSVPLFRFRPKILILIPVLYFLNGASPYVGLKTESTVSMFSNLHTEGGRTNHLIHGQLPISAGYQNDLVYILGTNGRPSGADATAVVRFEFDRQMARGAAGSKTIRYKGELRTVDDSWRNSYLEASWWERKVLIFKPVDFTRPKACTH
jgi:hypothetical protein